MWPLHLFIKIIHSYCHHFSLLNSQCNWMSAVRRQIWKCLQYFLLKYKIASYCTLCIAVKGIVRIWILWKEANTTCKSVLIISTSCTLLQKDTFVNFLRVQDTMYIVVNKFFLLLSAWISQIPHWSQCSFSQLLKILSKNLVVSYCEYNPSLLGGRICVKGYDAIDTYSVWEIMTLTPPN